jgi:3-deoxy-manno-octulosonate cytidylyltransferase (CMP-KDO synthetase)
MRTLVVIPARYGSTRFPGKPLQPVLGVPLLQRVFAIARSVVGDVIVSTDDERIARFAERLGAEAIMTSPDIRNGTERVAATLDLVPRRPDFIVNLQGDAVLTPPWVVEALIGAAEADPSLQMATPATRMTPDSYERLKAAKAAGEVGGTTVTFDQDGRALYFSKSIIPFVRAGARDLPVFRHIGLYGYRPDALRRLVSLEPGPLEKAEQLEQLRALEHGIPIRVVTVDYRGRTHWGIDTEEDLGRCEALIRAEGELLPTYETGSGTIPC